MIEESQNQSDSQMMSYTDTVGGSSIEIVTQDSLPTNYATMHGQDTCMLTTHRGIREQSAVDCCSPIPVKNYTVAPDLLVESNTVRAKTPIHLYRPRSTLPRDFTQTNSGAGRILSTIAFEKNIGYE